MITELFDFTALPDEFKCLTNTEAGYFSIEAEASTNDFIIWLGDSDLCNSIEECSALCRFKDAEGNDICNENAFNRFTSTAEELRECYFRRLNCDSEQWRVEEPSPLTILEEFTNFNRVFIPQCTFDLFLGNNVGNFDGAGIFNQVLSDLNIDGDSNIILGGSRFAGIGALNLASFVQNTFNPNSLRLIIDSAWLIKSFDFGNSDDGFQGIERLERNVENYIQNAELDPGCRERFEVSGNLVNCLIPSELLEYSTVLADIPILFVQSQYDGTLLAEFGVFNEETFNEFEDPQNLVTNGIQFIEQIGATVRQTTQKAAELSNNAEKVFFMSSCSDHASIVPISLLEISPRNEDFGAAGSIKLSRTGDSWDIIKVNNQSLKETVTKFISEEFTESEVIGEFCGSFLCGETCQLESDVEAFVLDLQTDESIQFGIILLSVSIIGFGWLAFCSTYFRVLMFRRETNKHWKTLSTDNTVVERPRDLLRVLEGDNDDFFDEIKNRKNFIAFTVTKLTYLAPPRLPRGEPFTILRDVSLVVKPNEVHALMGPSGSGKSTLLDILSLTRTEGIIRGTHYINGIPSHIQRMSFLRQWLKQHLSYVRQQDVLFPLLTVRQHLTHAAWLMLPQSMPSFEKIQRVKKVAKLLGLEHALDTKIGDGGLRIEGGLSGGERRRVSVATQLLKLPAAIVLDEPTSGLDSSNALLLVRVLHKLAHEAGICVFLTIHQPRREIFAYFDRMTILLDGRITFSGSPADAGAFFKFRIDEVNIGDDILDKLEDYRGNARQLAAIQKKYTTGPLGKNEAERIRSEETYLTRKKANNLRDRLKHNAKLEGRVSWAKQTTTWSTTKVLLSRTMYRGGFDLERTVFVSLFGGVLVGTVFLDNDSYTQSAALAYLIVATMSFLQATFLGTRYQLEKGMWSHEKDAGTTVSWKAFIISLFIRNIVTSTIEGLAFAIPVYLMGKLNTDKSERFPLFLLLLVLVAICVISQNTLVEIDRIRNGGISGPDLRQAALINMSLLSLGALFNGFIIPLDDIPPFLQWVPYLMLTFWGFVGILVNNFRDFTYDCDVNVLECATRTGDSLIVEFSYDNIDVFQAMAALCGLIIFYHILGVLDFYLRFVRVKSTIKREEVAGDTRKYSREEREHGFAGKTMKALIRENQPKSKRNGKYKSKAKPGLGTVRMETGNPRVKSTLTGLTARDKKRPSETSMGIKKRSEAKSKVTLFQEEFDSEVEV